MRRIIKEKDDIKVSIFSGDRLARVFIDSGYRNIAMVIADCGRIANGCYHIHQMVWYIHLIWKENRLVG